MTSIHRRHLLRHAGTTLAMALVGRPRAALGATDGAVSGAMRWLATGDIGGLMLLDVVAGEPAGSTAEGTWLLDTGAESDVVSPEMSARLQLAGAAARRVATPGGATMARSVVLPTLRSEAVVLRTGATAVVLDLAPHHAASGEPVLGILGWPTLGAQPWLFDLAAQRWAAGPRADATGGALLQALPCSADHALPIVLARLGDRAPLPLLLDTGFAGALMLWGDAAAAIAPGGGTAIAVDDIAGPIRLDAVLLGALQLGATAWRDVPALLLARSPLAAAAGLQRVHGAVGMALFEGALLAIDGPSSTASTSAGAAGDPLPGGFGFGLAPRADGGLQATQVAAGGPAAIAGVRAGDRLLGVDGQPIVGTSPAQVWAKLRGVEAVELGWQRGARRTDVRLQRARFFPQVA